MSILTDLISKVVLGTDSNGKIIDGTTGADSRYLKTTTKLDDLSAPDDNTDLNASTSNHGLVVKATAPASGLVNVVGIANGETAYTNKPLFDANVPSTQAFGDSASAGSATVAARRDHKHAMPSSPALPSGIIAGWGGNIASVPSGYLFCNGAAVSRSTFSALFAAIGTIWGVGDGSTTFNLPDSRDKFTVGAKEDESGVPKTNIVGTLLQTGGSRDHTHTAYDSGHYHNLAWSGGASGIRFDGCRATVDVNGDGATVSCVPIIDENGWTGCTTLITDASGACGYTDVSCGTAVSVESADNVPPFISYPSIIKV